MRVELQLNLKNLLVLPVIVLSFVPVLSAQKTELLICNEGKDTLYLDPVGNGKCTCTNSLVKEVQVNRKGPKELLVKRSCSGIYSNTINNLTFDQSYKLTQFEIHDTETKELIFTSINEYYSVYEYTDPENAGQNEKGIEEYNYTFDLSGDGTVTIGEYHGNGAIKPDHEPGIYRFRRGEFVRKGK